jgi:hypothetical protein
MSETVSIAATALGILVELLAVILLARLLDSQIPKKTLMACFGIGTGLSILIAVGFAWGLEPILIGCLLLALVPGTSIGAYGILVLVRRLNWRDDPIRRQSHSEPRWPAESN